MVNQKDGNPRIKNRKKLEDVNDSISNALRKIEAQLIIVQNEITLQKGEKEDRAAELLIADKELAYQSGEKADRAAECIVDKLFDIIYYLSTLRIRRCR